MKRQRVLSVWLGLLLVGPFSASAARHSALPQPAQAQAPRQQPRQLILIGRVVQIHTSRFFTMREPADDREVLVFAPRPVSPAMAGARVRIQGVLRRLDPAELKRIGGWSELDERTRQRVTGRPVLVATSIVAALEGEPAPPAPPADVQPMEPREPMLPRDSDMGGRLTVRAAMFVAYVDGLAGRELRILNARVVGVFEPHAFLIEPATPYLKPVGRRDRVLVLIDKGALRVRSDLLVGSTVVVVGIARTLLGIRVTGDAPWPAQVTPGTIERLEIRAAVLATSVQTAEGTELTDRPPAAPVR